MEVERDQQAIGEIARLGSIKDVFAEEAANASPTVAPKISGESSKLKLQKAPMEGQTLFSAGLKSKQKQLDQLRENRKNMEFDQLCYQVTRRVQDNRSNAEEKMKKIFTKIDP